MIKRKLKKDSFLAELHISKTRYNKIIYKNIKAVVSKTRYNQPVVLKINEIKKESNKVLKLDTTEY